MTAFCPACNYPAKNAGALVAHQKFQHEGGDPVVEQPAPIKTTRTRKVATVLATGQVLVAVKAGKVVDVVPTPDPKPSFAARMKAAKAAKKAVPIHPTREAWMLAAVDAMRPWFEEHGSKVGPVSISIGWAGGRGKKVGVRGQCWASHTTANGLPAIFVTPDQSDPLTIVGIILHEMDHAADDGKSGHKGEFAKLAKALGFLPPWTSSDAKTPELIDRLRLILKDLGTFPHGAIKDSTHGLTGQGPLAPPVQTTRMLKVQCEECGCILRMTNKWIEDAGLPTCGCGGEMVQP